MKRAYQKGVRSVRRLFKLHRVLAIALTLGIIGLIVGGGVYASLGGAPKNADSGDVELSRGLVGHWKLDGNGKDSTPYENNGTVTSATLVADRKGKTDSAYTFTSSTNNITIPDNPALGSSLMSVSAWVNPVSIATGGPIYNRRAAGNVGGVTIEAAGASTVYCYFYIGGSWRFAQTAAVSLSQWSLITCTYDGSNIRAYLNGVQSNATAAVGTVNNPASSTVMIGKNAQSVNYWNGSIDDVRVYNRALSAAEAKALAGDYDESTKIASGQKDLLGWWRFDGNIKDSSPYGMNASLVNGATLGTDRKGQASFALSLGGGTQYASTPYTTILDFGSTEDFTISAWVNPTTVANTPFIIDKRHTFGGLTAGFTMYLNANGLPVLRLSDNAAVAEWAATGTAVSAGSWHLYTIAASRSGLTYFYIDGVQRGSATISGIGSLSGGNGLFFGTKDATAGNALTGLIDDPRVYNRQLSASDVSSLYGSFDSQVTVSDLQKGLLDYWPLNGNTKDSSPRGFNLTNNGPLLTTDRKDRANSAYTFNGTTDYMTTATPFGDQPLFTWSAWIYPTNVTKDQVFFTKAAANYFRVVNSKIFGSFAIGLQRTKQGNTTLSNSQWYHAAVTYDGSNMTLYLNGIADAGPVTGITGSINFGASVLDVGRYLAADPRAFEGKIDDARMYNRALTAAEIKALYGIYK